jgi:hypothetical protein
MNETKRAVRCRYLDRLNNPCPNAAVVEDADILICAKHLAKAARLWNEVKAAAIAAGVKAA